MTIDTLRKKLIKARESKEYKLEAEAYARGTERAATGGYLWFGRAYPELQHIINRWRVKMSTRAQIGIYEDEDLKSKPVAMIYRHSDGYPTGDGAVMPTLLQIVPEIVKKHGSYDAEYLGAQLVYRLIENHDCGVSGLGYGIGGTLHGDIRFYYAVTPEGVHVFDARELQQVNRLPKRMFFTPWGEPEKVKTLQKELSDLATQFQAKQSELKALKDRQASGR